MGLVVISNKILIVGLICLSDFHLLIYQTGHFNSLHDRGKVYYWLNIVVSTDIDKSTNHRISKIISTKKSNMNWWPKASWLKKQKCGNRTLSNEPLLGSTWCYAWQDLCYTIGYFILWTIKFLTLLMWSSLTFGMLSAWYHMLNTEFIALEVNCQVASRWLLEMRSLLSKQMLSITRSNTKMFACCRWWNNQQTTTAASSNLRTGGRTLFWNGQNNWDAWYFDTFSASLHFHQQVKQSPTTSSGHSSKPDGAWSVVTYTGVIPKSYYTVTCSFSKTRSGWWLCQLVTPKGIWKVAQRYKCTSLATMLCW